MRELDYVSLLKSYLCLNRIFAKSLPKSLLKLMFPGRDPVTVNPGTTVQGTTHKRPWNRARLVPTTLEQAATR